MMNKTDNNIESHLQEFGTRLKKARKLKSLTQKSFAEIGKVSVQSQRLYEAGERSPNSEYLFNISSLDIDINNLVTGIGPKIIEVNKQVFRSDILTEILEVLENWPPESFTIQTKAELISLFYINFSELGKVNHDLMHGYINLVQRQNT